MEDWNGLKSSWIVFFFDFGIWDVFVFLSHDELVSLINRSTVDIRHGDFFCGNRH